MPKKGTWVTRMSSRGQIVMPLHLRERLDIMEGDVLHILEHEGKIILQKIVHTPSTSSHSVKEALSPPVQPSVHRNPPSYIH
ncbi:AbrB/MazE/SpoVT family DNA-binding domain-containing protein [Candidatus Pacearchaeota archaeon]|nr:AbrB/MazE/SpoVT family DNA-binding domain-containing protein [Candidatus Pacearchaeota archaeon]